MKKTFFILLALIAVFLVFLFGCKQMPSGEETSTTPAVSESTESTELGASTVVLLYTEEVSSIDYQGRSWSTVKIWQKAGDAEPEVVVEKIGKVGEYPIGFVISPDNENLLINLESKLQILDLETKELKDLFTPKKEVGSFEFSEDGKKLLVWDQKYATDDYEYFLSELNLADGTSEVLMNGVTEGTYAITKWVDDSLVLLKWLGGEVTNSAYINLEGKIFNITPTANSGGDFSDSSTGRYIYFSTDWVTDPCNDMMGGGPSVFAVADPVTGKKVNSFGDKTMLTSVVSFSADDSKVLYRVAKPADSYDQCADFDYFNGPDWKYYVATIIGDTTPTLVDDYLKLLKEWYPNKPVIEYKVIDGNYGPVVDGEAVDLPHNGTLITAFFE